MISIFCAKLVKRLDMIKPIFAISMGLIAFDTGPGVINLSDFYVLAFQFSRIVIVHSRKSRASRRFKR
jgi:hypothetical protein